MPTDEIQLLRDYAATRSQEAFALLVERYVDLVYSAARRQCHGDAHLAEDVTQAAFMILADRAATVPPDRPLSAWLLKTTSYCAANARRAKTNRQNYERRAAEMAQMNDASTAEESEWADLSPMLDEGMNKLRPQDRDALLLRFFEKKTLRQIGDALGISEEAAGKRVARAVDRLRDFFRRRGVAVSAAALPVLLMSNAAQAAPAAVLSAVVATTTSTAAAAATSATAAAATTTTPTSAAAVAKGALAVMAAEKAKAIALTAAAIILGVGASAVLVQAVFRPISRGSRQVAVAVAPRPVVTTTRTINNAWPVQLPDGVLIEVLGLCEPTAAPGQAGAEWWTLDGSPIPPPAGVTAAPVTVPRAPRSRVIQVMLRFNNLAANTGRVVILRPYLLGGTTATRTLSDAKDPATNGITHHVTLVPENQATADLYLGVGAGAWETIATYDASDLRSSIPGGSPHITKFAEEGGSLVVEATLPPGARAVAAAASAPQRDEHLVAITDTGEVREPSNRSTFNGVVRHRFPIPLAGVRRLEWRSRPFTFVRLSNVSLRRAEPTNVQMTRTPPPPAATALPRRAAAAAAGG